MEYQTYVCTYPHIFNLANINIKYSYLYCSYLEFKRKMIRTKPVLFHSVLMGLVTIFDKVQNIFDKLSLFKFIGKPTNSTS